MCVIIRVSKKCNFQGQFWHFKDAENSSDLKNKGEGILDTSKIKNSDFSQVDISYFFNNDENIKNEIENAKNIDKHFFINRASNHFL